MTIPLSVLDLAPIIVGGTAAQAFRNSLDLAKHVEKRGYHRYWLAEHHNMTGIASSATSVVIGHIAGGTSTIRVGSGGVMLPNHAPLVIAEQFGTLESLYPGRIDLGLGRAPGSDQATARALRRDLGNNGEDFPELVHELRTYFNPPEDQQTRQVRAIPGEGLNIPIWLLGSSSFSARLAGQLGLPFSFASHFSPTFTLQALELYRSSFRPSEMLDAPYAMVCVNVIAADTDERAQWLATSMQQQFLNLIRGRPGQLNPPVDNMDELWTPLEKNTLQEQLRYTFVGNEESVQRQLQSFLDETGADEIMINSQIYDHQARLHSYEIVSHIAGKLRKE
ncbi:LLM class flavin-dependent oxidoreductase [Brevibacillus sp. SYSU BS000544]|uniref:LLM class flavin-dependent oxidoreductase n=1 Tax=Brevibacillus sp. SYSU BS000544 TaxID=3416443 RepID=UPI003CE57D62